VRFTISDRSYGDEQFEGSCGEKEYVVFRYPVHLLRRKLAPTGLRVPYTFTIPPFSRRMSELGAAPVGW
jgi:hypothetical protein